MHMETFVIDPRTPLLNNRMKEFLKKYFENKNKTGNWVIYTKAAIFLISLFALIIILSMVKQFWLFKIIECVLLGIVISGIGFNVMHDAVHNSFSKKKWVNFMFGLTLNLLGGDFRVWKNQHNGDHHMNTNIDGLDGDIDLGILGRLHPSQKRRSFHKYQHIYLPWIMYPISYLGWVLYFDFPKAKKMGFKFWQYVSLVFSKLIHIGIFIVFPLFFNTWVEVLIGYATASVVTGTITSFTFQLAHVVEKTEMFVAPENTVIKNDAVHQLKTTADFATKNKLLSWYVGGLNFQREHHLFYKISHVHYPDIHKELKVACADLNLPDHEYPSVVSAVKSHISQLKYLGNND